MSESSPITKQVPVAMDVPRDPEEIRPTIHFTQQLKKRVPSDEQDQAVRETIKYGDHHGSYHPDGRHGDHDCVQQYFKVVGESWTVVLGVNPDAYQDSSAKHLAITIYPAGSKQ
jgi:hypothetical protein